MNAHDSINFIEISKLDVDRYFRPVVISVIPIRIIFIILLGSLNVMFIIIKKKVIIPNMFISISNDEFILFKSILNIFVSFIFVFR